MNSKRKNRRFDDDSPIAFERTERKARSNREHVFRCSHCRKEVSTTSFGTMHRNHCPYCLWSLHVDESIGDRQSHCRSSMRPIGLSEKVDGELMIVHQCTGCGKISANRIAGDDSPITILELFDSSDSETLETVGYIPVENRDDVSTQMFGKTKI